MGLFGWFSKSQTASEPSARKTPAPRAVPPPDVVVSETEPVRPSEPEPVGEQAFGGAVATGLTRYLQAQAPEMRSQGDKQFVSLLLRAVRNDGVEVPAMPADLMEIKRLLAEPETDISQLARAVQRDPSIAAKFVSVANSPLYRGLREVSSVREAIVRIGLNHTGMILLAIITSSKLFKVPGYEAEAKWLHGHSLSTAIICQYLARQVGENEETAFMSGMLHDLGRVFILSVAQDVFRQSKGTCAVSPELVERFATHLHSGFSALTAQVWNYKGGVVSALQYHEVPEEAAGRLLAMAPVEHEVLIQIVAAANLIDRTADDEPIPAAVPEFLRALGLAEVEEVIASARETSQIFLQDLGVSRAPRPY